MIRDEISKIFGVLIQTGQYEKVFAELAVEGRLTEAKLQQVIIVLLKKVESLEQAVLKDEPPTTS